MTSEAVDEATSEKNEEAVTEEATLAPEAESEVAAPMTKAETFKPAAKWVAKK